MPTQTHGEQLSDVSLSFVAADVVDTDFLVYGRSAVEIDWLQLGVASPQHKHDAKMLEVSRRQAHFLVDSSFEDSLQVFDALRG